MSEFNKLLGEFLDKTIISLDEIATNTEKFIAQCTECGSVPEHPADVARKNYVKENFDIEVPKLLPKELKQKDAEEEKKEDEEVEEKKEEEKKPKKEEKVEEKKEEEEPASSQHSHHRRRKHRSEQ